MTLSNTFDISPEHPLWNPSFSDIVTYPKIGNNIADYPQIVNQCATLSNNTRLAPLRQDMFRGRHYYCGDSPGTHKGISWKTILAGAGTLACVIGALKFGLSRLGSFSKNPQIKSLMKQIKKANRDIAVKKSELAQQEKINELQKTLNDLIQKLNNL